MTRRIARSIFVTVALMLVIGGLVAFFTTRAVLLRQLDESLVNRALSIPVVASAAGEQQANHARYAEKDDRYVVRTDEGRSVASIRAGETGIVRPQLLSAAFFSTADGWRGRSITVRTVVRDGPETNAKLSPATVIYSGSAEQFHAAMFRIGLTLLICVSAGALIAAVVAVQVARATLEPLRDTAATIHEIDEQQLHRRLDVQALPPELHTVAIRLNEMLLRLESSVDARRRFLDDISHELRTPIAAMAAALQVTLRLPREPRQYREAMEVCLSEARHLRQLVDLLTQQAWGSDASESTGEASFDLLQMLCECVALATSLGEDRNIKVTLRQPPGSLSTPRIRGASLRLRSAVMNAMSNAVQYSRIDGHVEVRWSADANGGIVLAVCDDGIGIDAKHIPHVFEPFYRVRAARGGEEGHFGLGLFILRAHVQAMGGRCAIESELNRGTTLKIILPPTATLEMIEIAPVGSGAIAQHDSPAA